MRGWCCLSGGLSFVSIRRSPALNFWRLPFLSPGFRSLCRHTQVSFPESSQFNTLIVSRKWQVRQLPWKQSVQHVSTNSQVRQLSWKKSVQHAVSIKCQVRQLPWKQSVQHAVNTKCQVRQLSWKQSVQHVVNTKCQASALLKKEGNWHTDSMPSRSLKQQHYNDPWKVPCLGFSWKQQTDTLAVQVSC